MQRVFSQDFSGQNVLFTFILNNTVDITKIYYEYLYQNYITVI